MGVPLPWRAALPSGDEEDHNCVRADLLFVLARLLARLRGPATISNCCFRRQPNPMSFALRSWTGKIPNPFKTELIAAPARYILIKGTPGPRLSALSEPK
jgi:hypothetical protein